jgi:PKD repeat protein
VVSLFAVLTVVALAIAPGVAADTNVAPTVTATVSNSNPVEPQTVIASATFTDPESATETYTCSIDYGDGSAPVAGVLSGTACTGPAHQYTTSGSYLASVSVTDSGGAEGSGTAPVTYTNVAPTLLKPILLGAPRLGYSVNAATAISDPGLGGETYDCVSVDYGDGSGLQPGWQYVPTGWGDGLPRCVYSAHTYSTWGTFTVTTTVRDGGGNLATVSMTQQILPSDPFVDGPGQMVVLPSNGIWHLDQTVSLVDNSVPSPGPWAWTIGWGDGTTSDGTATSPGAIPFVHDYLAAGTYTVNVRVQDADWAGGYSGTRQITVIAYSGAPTVIATDSQTVGEGIPGTFGWGVVDPVPHLPYSVHVDWGDGSVLDFLAQTPSSYFVLPHTYRASDPYPTTGVTVYTATMTVTDATGAHGSASMKVPTADVAPVITAPATISVPEGPMVNLTLATFTDASVGPWQIAVFNSKGGMVQQTLQTPSPIVVPWDPSWGTATVDVYVRDRGGLYSTATIAVSTLNSPPVVGPVSLLGGTIGDQPILGQAVFARAAFTDPGSSLPQPETYVCTVDYGDGSGPQSGTAVQGLCNGAGHTYAAVGVFTISIIVSDSRGGSGSSSRTVTVQSGAPQVGPVVVPSPLVEGQAFVATATFSATSPQRCAVDWGNGTWALGTITGSTCSAPNFAYSDVGTYTITFAITDASGAVGSAQATAVVGNVPPVLSRIVTSGTPAAGDVLTVFDLVYDPGTLETLTCTVDFGDGTGPKPGVIGDGNCTANYTYSQGGLYTVTMTVTDSNGGSGSASTSVAIANLSPTVGPITVTGSPIEGGSVQASVAFTDPWSGNSFYTCAIDFGDGTGTTSWIVNTHTCMTPMHSYAHPGTFTISLAVDRGYGSSGTSTLTVTVANVAPVVTPDHIVTPAPAGVNQVTSVDFTDPGLGIETYTCTIDYGDGGGAKAGVISGNVCAGPDHAYASKGTYSLAATVTDSNGGSGTYSVSIVIYNQSPSVGPVSVPSSALVGTAVTASAAYTPTGLVPADTCSVDFGDGSGPQTATANGTTCTGPSHKYSATGTFAIVVKILAANGATASSSATIQVYSLQVGAVTTSGSLTEGSAVTASASFTPVGSQTYACKVDYGDGSGTQTGSISGTTCKGPSHKYLRPGSFAITVKVSGSKGNSGTSSKTVDIANVMPVFTTVTLPTTAKVGQSVTVSASFTDPGTAETYMVVVDWADGTRVPVALKAGDHSFSTSHTYKVASDYPVVLELSDDQMAHAVTAVAGIAVYDPARTLMGSGTFASPAGACQLTTKCAAPSMATFAVSASYAKGATKPTAGFTFSAIGISFVATSFDWYIVADNGRGMLQGSGKVNGVSGYRFCVYTIDGAPDEILVAIFDSKGNAVYYNNDYTPLTTGSITIK